MSPCRSAAATILLTIYVAAPKADAVSAYVAMAMCALTQFQPALGQIYTHTHTHMKMSHRSTQRKAALTYMHGHGGRPLQSGTAEDRSNPAQARDRSHSAQRKTATTRHSGRPLNLICFAQNIHIQQHYLCDCEFATAHIQAASQSISPPLANPQLPSCCAMCTCHFN